MKESNCKNCNGTGKYPKNEKRKCFYCKGSGDMKEDEFEHIERYESCYKKSTNKITESGSYYRNQFKKLFPFDSDGSPMKVKFSNEKGDTNWMDVTEDFLEEFGYFQRVYLQDID